MMRTRDFPPVRNCDLCKQIFTLYKDPNDNDPDSRDLSTWRKMRSKGLYAYPRTMRDLATSVKFGCIFCLQMAFYNDEYYVCGDDDEEAREGSTGVGYLSEGEVEMLMRFDEQRSQLILENGSADHV